MKRLLRFALIGLLLAGASGMAQTGVRPRSQPSDYPASGRHTEFSIGAAQLSDTEVQRAFATGLNHGYVVVEVGVFPAGGTAVEITPDDFALRIADSKTVLRPVRPQTIAANLQKNPPTQRDITINPVASIGYESGSRDVYGNRYPGGTTTAVGVGVGIGGSRPASTAADRQVMETELKDKELRDGRTEKPVAGYLYFPRTTRQKVVYQLEYKDVRLKLPPSPPRKDK
jgi:hypothetical protein